MMRYLLLGALLGVLLLYPTLLGVVAAVVAGILSKPLVVAFGLGIVARPAITRRMRGWAP